MTEKKVKPQVMATGIGFGLIVLSLVVYILQVAGAIIIPFMIAMFLWYLINAIARGINSIPHLGADIPRFVSFFFAILALIAGLWFTYKLISTNAADVIQAAPVFQQKFIDFLPTLLAALPEFYQPNINEVIQYLNVGGFITALVRTFTGIAGQTLIVLFYTGFLLFEQQFFSRKLRKMIGNSKNEKRVRKVLHNIDLKIQRYIWVKTLVSSMTGTCTWLLLTYFGIDFAEFWGVMAFVLNFIPFVGSLAAIILPTIAATVQIGMAPELVGVIGGLCAIQIIWGSIIDPRLLGDSLNLSPIFIIFSLGAWGMIWGVPGMFLSIPILAMIVITLSQFPATHAIAIMMSKTGEIETEK